MSFLEDGHSTLIGMELLPGVLFCEKRVTPPGLDGGGANDVTTMKNETWRTMAPKKLITMTNGGAKVAYDPAVYSLSQIQAVINVNQKLTVTFPDLSKVEFFGWLNKFEPDEVVEGEQPEADVEFIPSNRDSNTGDEAGPTYIPAP